MSILRIAALAVVLVASVVPTAHAATGSPPPIEDCQWASAAEAKVEADKIMAGQLTLKPHAAVSLAANPTWREAPFSGTSSNSNWLFSYHSLRWLLPLLQVTAQTADAAYADRASFLMQDWLRTNPRSAPASPMAWDDHATAWRASVLACAGRVLGRPTWLLTGLTGHGTALADPAFYKNHGNHALNQSIGLLDVGCQLGQATWKSLASRRLATLVVELVDVEGVALEQSIGYQLYDWQNLERARRHLTSCGQAIPTAFGRVALMPQLLAYGTAPDGSYEQIGDTDLRVAKAIPGTVAEYAATAGASGPRPSSTVKRFTAGYLFARSGWGASRPFAQETSITVRFGPGLIAHGHADGTSITLSARGRRLLVDPGKYTYTAGGWRTWFVGRTAHNVVSVDGLRYDASRATTLSTKTTSSYLLALLDNTGYAGVQDRRRILWARASDYLIVDDTLSASISRTFRQTWHLAYGSAPTISGNRLDTHLSGGNLAIVQLRGTPANRVISGRQTPIQGWLSFEYGKKVAAPVLESTLSGRSARFLTLLVPYAGSRPDIRARVIKVASDGYVVDVTIGSRTERVTVSVAGTSVVAR